MLRRNFAASFASAFFPPDEQLVQTSRTASLRSHEKQVRLDCGAIGPPPSVAAPTSRDNNGEPLWRILTAAAAVASSVGGLKRRRRRLCCRTSNFGIGRRRDGGATCMSAAIEDSSIAEKACTSSTLVAVASGSDVRSVPVWLFRQAGRHLPEYSAFKRKRRKNFLELLEDPEDVAEVTMQPLRRYALDAAILFSDILVVPQALGLRVDMPGGKGITLLDPLRAGEDLGRLPSSDEVSDPAWVRTRLTHVMEAVRAILRQMREEKRMTPLIGFSAAPWTLLFYMVGGSSRKETRAGERWLVAFPEESARLLTLLTDVVIEYLSAQVEAGCRVLQIFEAMADFISRENFEAHAQPALVRIAAELRRRHSGVPLMIFARGAGYASPALQRAGYDVITVDRTTSLRKTEKILVAEAESGGLPPAGHLAALQGNFDAALLRPAENVNVHTVRDAVREMLRYRGLDGHEPARCGLIANLGEGLAGSEDPVLVEAFVDAVHELSSELCGHGNGSAEGSIDNNSRLRMR
eukprot:TRINITY_DN40557_c0_g1_i1.p1 TRINITY_DN40557_c0_g1~~TRINITY_DN40557_c0_g1_i1.p1  ORF type:complete len:522 (-),score=75.95 TRINITY_DN40557_c0_g1_i1:327-1892(-)